MRIALRVAAISVVLVFANSARAQVPAAVFTVNGVGPTGTNPGLVESTYPALGGSWTSSGIVEVNPGTGTSGSPVISVISDSVFNPTENYPFSQYDNIESSADLTFYFEVNGPASTMVTLDVGGYLLGE